MVHYLSMLHYLQYAEYEIKIKVKHAPVLN